MMRLLALILYVIVGIVNLIPVAGVLGSDQLEALYGTPFSGDDTLLLIRHRAVLLGALGAFILIAAFRPRLRTAAAVAGLASMLSFMVLMFPLSAHTEELRRVFWVDTVASVLLAMGYWASYKSARSAKLDR